MRAGGLWEAVAPLPGGLGGRPLHCRATGPPGASAQILSENFAEKPLPPRSGATRSRPPGSRAARVSGRPGYISVNFENENIFL